MTENTFSVHDLIQRHNDVLKFHPVSGEQHLSNEVFNKEINRPSLQLTGFFDIFLYDRIQILGNTENSYLKTLPSAERRKRLQDLFEYDMPAVVITAETEFVEELYEVAAQAKCVLLKSELPSTTFIACISDILYQELAPKESKHGVLLDVFGMGLMMVGASGVGKSELAIAMIQRGHRLVADDLVVLHRTHENTIVGKASERLGFHIEVRGLGIFDAKRMFGIQAVCLDKQLLLVVELELWDPKKAYDRTGMDARTIDYLGVELPFYTIPVKPGRATTSLLEVAAMQQRIRNTGVNPAEEFDQRLINLIQQNKKTEK